MRRCCNAPSPLNRQCLNIISSDHPLDFLCNGPCVFDNYPYAKFSDPISPNHYKGKNGLEARHVIDAFELGFYLGNVIKYTLRGGRKANVSKEQDLRKARQYIDFELESITKEAK